MSTVTQPTKKLSSSKEPENIIIVHRRSYSDTFQLSTHLYTSIYQEEYLKRKKRNKNTKSRFRSEYR